MADILARKDGRSVTPIAASTAATAPASVISPRQTVSETSDPKRKPNIRICCRWCGGEIKKTHVDNFDKLFPNPEFDKEGLVDIVYNYEPCENCRKVWNTAVIILETTEKEPYPDCLPIPGEDSLKLYPTGRYVGVEESIAKSALGENAHNGSVFFMDKAVFEENFKDSFKEET